MQELMVSLNDFAMLCPFMKVFKFALNSCLSIAIANNVCTLSDEAISELLVWAACIENNKQFFPIPARLSPPPPLFSLAHLYQMQQEFHISTNSAAMRGWGELAWITTGN
jgi:hypothetical protein